MEGYSIGEITHRLGCTPRTVERSVDLIRQIRRTEGEARSTTA